MPFSLEGAAFFLEAIFLGRFLSGGDRLPPPLHLFFAFMVGLCGVVEMPFYGQGIEKDLKILSHL